MLKGIEAHRWIYLYLEIDESALQYIKSMLKVRSDYIYWALLALLHIMATSNNDY